MRLASETPKQFAEFVKAFIKGQKEIIKCQFTDKEMLNAFIEWHQNFRISKEDDMQGGAPGEVRTRNLWRRRPKLYPVELRVHICFKNYVLYYENRKKSSFF